MQLSFEIWDWQKVLAVLQPKIGRELNQYEQDGMRDIIYDLATQTSVHPKEVAANLINFNSKDDGDDWTIPSYYSVTAAFFDKYSVFSKMVSAAA